LFSATLITKFSGNFDDLNEKKQGKKEKTDSQIKKEQKAQLNALVAKIQMAKEPKLFDLTTKAVTAENLFESKIFCQTTEKDVYLYYFLCKYVGRTLVFSNSINCVRRLTNLFRLLKKTPLHLHANMNQKQRLKNLEKFNGKFNSIKKWEWLGSRNTK
jgi:ATP-dependent RNA helicase DDX24/MAK5